MEEKLAAKEQTVTELEIVLTEKIAEVDEINTLLEVQRSENKKLEEYSVSLLVCTNSPPKHDPHLCDILGDTSCCYEFPPSLNLLMYVENGDSRGKELFISHLLEHFTIPVAHQSVSRIHAGHDPAFA